MCSFAIYINYTERCKALLSGRGLRLNSKTVDEFVQDVEELLNRRTESGPAEKIKKRVEFCCFVDSNGCGGFDKFRDRTRHASWQVLKRMKRKKPRVKNRTLEDVNSALGTYDHRFNSLSSSSTFTLWTPAPCSTASKSAIWHSKQSRPNCSKTLSVSGCRLIMSPMIISLVITLYLLGRERQARENGSAEVCPSALPRLESFRSYFRFLMACSIRSIPFVMFSMLMA